jgi:ParB family chromosome partitioning protein
MALIENIQREDLNPLEEAQGIARLISEFDFTHEQAANAVGRSRSAVSNLLRLVNLAQPVQTMLMAGDIDMGHARALLAVDAASQIALANQVIAKRLSVRETEKLVARTLEEQNAPAAARARRKSRATSCAWKKNCRTAGHPGRVQDGPEGQGPDDHRLCRPRRARERAGAPARLKSASSGIQVVVDMHTTLGSRLRGNDEALACAFLPNI